MAILVADGFDHYDTSADLKKHMAIIKDTLLTDYIKKFKIDLNDPDLFKDIYHPSLTKQIFDHRVDALTYSLNASRNLYDAKRTEEQQRYARDVYRDVGGYIDPLRPKSAYDLLFNPDVIDKFLWGPKGEFTGFVKFDDAHRQFNNSPTGKWRVEGGRFTLNMEIGLVPYGDEVIEWGHKDFYNLFGMHRQYGLNNYNHNSHCPQLVRFTSYQDMVEYHSFIHSDLGRANSVTVPVHELAGLLQNLRPVESAIIEWMDALKKAKAEYGFGCLRDGEGNMDPMGVLADINACDWVWDGREGAYKIEGGDAYSVPGKLLREYLGVPDDVGERHITDFQTVFPGMVDRCVNYNQVIDLIRNALDLIAFRLNEVRMWRNQGGDIRSVADARQDDTAVMFRPAPMPVFGRDSRLRDYEIRLAPSAMTRGWLGP